MDPIMLNSILLMVIVTACKHVLWYVVVHGKDYVSRNPKDNLPYYVIDVCV